MLGTFTKWASKVLSLRLTGTLNIAKVVFGGLALGPLLKYSCRDRLCKVAQKPPFLPYHGKDSEIRDHTNTFRYPGHPINLMYLQYLFFYNF